MSNINPLNLQVVVEEDGLIHVEAVHFLHRTPTSAVVAIGAREKYFDAHVIGSSGVSGEESIDVMLSKGKETILSEDSILDNPEGFTCVQFILPDTGEAAHWASILEGPGRYTVILCIYLKDENDPNHGLDLYVEPREEKQ